MTIPWPFYDVRLHFEICSICRGQINRAFLCQTGKKQLDQYIRGDEEAYL